MEHAYVSRQKFFLGVILFSMLFTASMLFAAPHYGDSYRLKQPDGTLVPVLVWGDEFYQRVEGVDGYTLIRNKEKWICYATLSRDGKDFVATDVVYTGTADRQITRKLARLNIQKHLALSPENEYAQRSARIKEMYPNDEFRSQQEQFTRTLKSGKGVAEKVIGLTLLIDFPDCEHSIPKEVMEEFTNGENFTQFGNNGSVAQYFSDVSGGKFEYENEVVGYYRTKKNKTYYDSEEGDRPREMVKEALAWAKNELNFDFSKITSSQVIVQINDTTFDTIVSLSAINVFYAGYPDLGWAKGLWPHSWVLYPYFDLDDEGKLKAFRYQMTNIGDDLSIGTFVHENGHMILGLPDLYSYYGTSRGVGRYCVMCANDRKNPQPFCAPFRWVLGWVDAKDISEISNGTTIELSDDFESVYKYQNPDNENELFLLENKNKTGRNLEMLDYGLMIWHADFTPEVTGGTIPGMPWGNHWNQMKPDSHYLVSVEQADNLFELEHNIGFGWLGDLYHSKSSPQFNDKTKPSAKWWSGSESGMNISNISYLGEEMHCVVGELPVTVTYPTSGDTLYGDDEVLIEWISSISGIERVIIELSRNGGDDWETIAGDEENKGYYKWKVPSIESEECVVKVTNNKDDSQKGQSYEFPIMCRPNIALDPAAIKNAVKKGDSKTVSVKVKNDGKGKLAYKVESRSLARSVLINEIYMGRIQKYPMNGMELFNNGPDVDIGGWKLTWTDNKGTSSSFTFPPYIFKSGKTVVVSKEKLAPNDSTFFLGQSVYWRDSLLVLSMSLLDKAGNGVDFIKTYGSKASAPKGCSWKGSGIKIPGTLFNNDIVYMYRTDTDDDDSREDWECDSAASKGTVNGLNPGQDNNNSLKPWIKVDGEYEGTVDGEDSKTFDVTLITENIPTGIYRDTIYVTHTGLNEASPMLLPVELNATSTSIADKPDVEVNNDAFTILPNPVNLNNSSSVTFTVKHTAIQQAKIDIYDAVGNLVYSGIYPTAKSWNLTQRSGARVAGGSYLVVLTVTYNDGTRKAYKDMLGIQE